MSEAEVQVIDGTAGSGVVDTGRAEVESEARAQGWVPKEEFRGKPEDWIDADIFVQRGKEINPILRKNNERFKAELERTKAEMAELKAAAEEFKKFQKDLYDRKAADLEKQIADLKKEKAQAVSSGDGERVNEIDDEIDSLKEQKQKAKEESTKEPPKPKDEPSVPNKELEDWKERNDWYMSDVRMSAAANAIAEQIAATSPHLRGKAFLDELDKELEQVFSPEKLGKKAKPRNPVEGGKGTTTPSSPGKKSYENLPPDAKAQCDRMVKQGLLTKEFYVQEYDWS